MLPNLLVEETESKFDMAAAFLDVEKGLIQNVSVIATNQNETAA